MKIGILTHHFVNNFGAFLQAYALREALAKEFPDDTVEIIDYIHLKQYAINSLGWVRPHPHKENFRCWLAKIWVPRTFARARKKHMVLSERCYSTAGINRLGYDTIVFGSDEIWNYQDKKSNGKYKFGCGITCKHKVAYAPSVGDSCGDIPGYVWAGMKAFRTVSVRDDLTEVLAKDVLGITPERVLDPTFLTDFPHVPSPVKKPYILFYYCDRMPVNKKKQIQDYAKEHGLAVYGAGEADQLFDALTVNITPFEWIDMFRNAEFVFTGTFHGVVFSVLNKRPFRVYLTNQSRIEKVNAFLRTCEIDNCGIEEEFTFDLTEEKKRINYESVYARINKQREESIAYLRNAVMSGRESES